MMSTGMEVCFYGLRIPRHGARWPFDLDLYPVGLSCGGDGPPKVALKGKGFKRGAGTSVAAAETLAKFEV